MKVHLYGNVLNNSYTLCKFLRKRGVNATMFLDNWSNHEQDYPWREDSSLSPTNLPEWIKYYNYKPGKLTFHFPNQEMKKMIKDFADCDVALVNNVGAIIAMRAKVPYFMYSLGTCLDMALIGDKIKKAIINLSHFQRPNALLTTLVLGGLQKRAIKKADRVGILMGYQIDTHARKLGIMHKIELMRLPWDIQKYEKNDDPELKKNYSEVDLVYFMPTRHVWQTLWEHDFCKGNDKFIRAFAKFVKDDKPNVKLICVKKGPDVSVSMKLISDLEIEEYVEWIDEMNKDGIRAYNSLDNIIIVDQFGHDDWKQRWPNNREFGIGFSAIGYEAMSARNVLISTFTDLQFYDNTAPPVFMAFSEDEIYAKLVETLKLSAEERKTVGEKGFEFFHKYHNWESTTDNFIRQLENILKSDD